MYILPTYRVREPYFKLRTDDFFFPMDLCEGGTISIHAKQVLKSFKFLVMTHLENKTSQFETLLGYIHNFRSRPKF